MHTPWRSPYITPASGAWSLDPPPLLLLVLLVLSELVLLRGCPLCCRGHGDGGAKACEFVHKQGLPQPLTSGAHT